MIPLTADGTQEDETILECGCFKPSDISVVRLDPSGLIKSWGFAKLSAASRSSLHHCTFDDDAVGGIFPKGDEQLARERNDGCLLQPPAVALDPVLEPMA
jgi:hypothetical protein